MAASALADVHETPEEFTFTADVPGMKDEDLSVEVNAHSRVLSVRGKRESVVRSVDEDPWQGRRHPFPHCLFMIHCFSSNVSKHFYG